MSPDPSHSDTGSGRVLSEKNLLQLVVCVGLLAFSVRALWMGEDANWDLQNYHRYSAYAVLHWRYPLDVGAGGFQGYLNPLRYLFPYGLSTIFPPSLVAVILAHPRSVILRGWCFIPQLRIAPWCSRWHWRQMISDIQPSKI